MSKQGWLSLPVLALCFAAFLGCPSASTDKPAPQQANAVAETAQALPAPPASGSLNEPSEPAMTEPVETKPAAEEQTSPAEKDSEEPLSAKAPIAAKKPAEDEPVAEPEPAPEKAPASEKVPAPEKAPAASEPAPEPDAEEKPRTKKAPAPAKKTAEKEANEDENDPVKLNGEIFVGWEKPKLAIVLTGEQLGYIEPCGCAGLENQKGGLRRRHTFLKLLAARGWPAAALDNGGLIRRFGRQAEIKYEKTVEGLKIMDYRAIGFGADDLKLPTGSVVASVTNVDAFVSANVGLFLAPGEEGAFLPRYRVFEVGGVKLGVTSVFGEAFQKEINNDEIKFLPPEVAIREVLPELKKEDCDFLILLSYASPEESEELAKQFPEFQAVVTAGGADEPPYEPETVKNSETLLVEVGHKGMYAIVLGLFDDEQTPLRYQRVPLDHRFKDAAEMDELMVNYQDQLKELGWEGLGLRPANHPRGKFVGSQACADCHQDAFDVWKETPHAHATTTLTKIKPPRQFDPECVSCHVTGWNPQEFFPYASGYDSLKSTPLLAGNGCENCHGPGEDHIAAENDGDEEAQARFRAALKLSLEDKDDEESVRRSCMECHDIDNSLNFEFKEYWPKVAH